MIYKKPTEESYKKSSHLRSLLAAIAPEDGLDFTKDAHDDDKFTIPLRETVPDSQRRDGMTLSRFQERTKRAIDRALNSKGIVTLWIEEEAKPAVLQIALTQPNLLDNIERVRKSNPQKLIEAAGRYGRGAAFGEALDSLHDAILAANPCDPKGHPYDRGRAAEFIDSVHASADAWAAEMGIAKRVNKLRATEEAGRATGATAGKR